MEKSWIFNKKTELLKQCWIHPFQTLYLFFDSKPLLDRFSVICTWAHWLPKTIFKVKRRKCGVGRTGNVFLELGKVSGNLTGKEERSGEHFCYKEQNMRQSRGTELYGVFQRLWVVGLGKRGSLSRTTSQGELFLPADILLVCTSPAGIGPDLASIRSDRLVPV